MGTVALRRRVRLPSALSLAFGVLAACRLGAAEPVRQHAPTRLSVEGSPEDVGQAVGKAQAETIRALHPIFLRAAERQTGQKKERLYARAAEIAGKLSAADREEIKGLATGSGVSCEDALFLNLFYTLTVDLPACRGLAAWDKFTADGELLHARNLDWYDYPGEPLKRHNLVLNVKPRDGIEHLILTWPGLQGVLTGTNRKGLTVSFNQLPGGRGRTAPLSEPVFFTLRRVLRSCATVDEAVKLIREAKPLGNGSVLISDATAKTAVVVEILDGETGMRKADGGLIANANHPTREAGWTGLRGFGPADSPAGDVARALGARLDVEKTRGVMADRRVLASINLLSVVFVPAKNKMHLSCGRTRAAEGEFKEYELFPEEKKP
jgi:hypothetical protein